MFSIDYLQEEACRQQGLWPDPVLQICDISQMSS